MIGASLKEQFDVLGNADNTLMSIKYSLPGINCSF